MGSYEDFVSKINQPDELVLGDELYLCVSRLEKKTIRRISKLFDHKVVRFYYVPLSVETIGLNLKREMIDDMEVFTTYENPLENSVNRAVKRVFDIALSSHEGLPIALLEAMSYRLPVVTSSIPANLEVRLDTSCYHEVGDVNALASSIESVANSPLQRIDYDMSKYNRDMIALQVETIYQSMGK